MQDLLTRLADTSQPPVSYVIVHKLDRLARDRADDVALLLAIRTAGAQLVSVSEQIDETPAGMLLHGIMATMAEFYSRNLSTEAKKGIAEKARRGGTIGYAPTGYINTTTRVVGDDGVSREAKTVIPDPARAPHIAWAFEEYDRGETSLSALTISLAARGLTTRDSRAIGKSLSRASVHRMLTNPYYSGKIVHRGVIYDGVHEPLVDEATFTRVQDRLADRKVAGDRSWRRDHYLKGSLICGRCGSRLGYSHNNGRGGEYAYFFCLGRAKKRIIPESIKNPGPGIEPYTGTPGTICDLPYVQADDIEKSVIRHWYTRTMSSVEAAAVHDDAVRELDGKRHSQSRDLKAAEKAVQRLTATKQRLLDAYLAEAVSLPDFQAKQAELGAQLVAAQDRLSNLTADVDKILVRVDLILSLLSNAGMFYEQCPPEARRLLNHAMFSRIRVEPDTTSGDPTEIIEAVTELGTVHQLPNRTEQAEQTQAQDAAHNATRAVLAPTGTEGTPIPQRSAQGRTTPHNEKNPRQAFRPDEGSNLRHLAVAEGFEPSVDFHPQTLSRRSP